MTTISTNTLTTLAASTDASKKKAGETYNSFLKLLTTQLQNQDPLDPADSSEFTNQLVQFSQVEQSIIGNEKLDGLLTQSNNSQIGQAIGYIGKDVYFKGGTVYNAGKDIKVGYAIDGDAKQAKLRIFDENNQVVRTLDVPDGTLSGNLTWDRKDDSGNLVASNKNYGVRVDALDATGVAIKTYTGVPGHVAGVETVQGILYLSLTGDTRVDATTVLSISEPDAAVPAS